MQLSFGPATTNTLSLGLPPNTMSKPYLFLYNAGQVAGWSLLLAQGCSHLLNHGLAGLYAQTSLTLQVFQTAAVLEILHAALGLVRSPVMVTFQQVFSRVYVTWAILHICPPSQDSIGFPLLLFAWTITEIIRYSMYAINLFSSPPFPLTWLRYTFFIIAYPAGVTGELLCSFSAMIFSFEKDLLSIHLPNALNVTFSFPLVILGIMLLYIPLFPPMYLHMFAQRKKVLGTSHKLD